MEYLITTGLFLPLFGFLFTVALYKTLPRNVTGIFASSIVFLSFICFLFLLIQAHTPLTISLFDWITVAELNAKFSLHLDTLSLLMALIITGVGSLIHIYSIGYTDHEEDYSRYFAFLNLFVFAMLLLVLAGDLLLLFVGWEGVGLASYLLIGYWYQRPSAAQAATKAFVVNRIGDIGFLLALLLTIVLFGTTDITQVNQSAAQYYSAGATVIVLLTTLYFFAATGKSAQLPLYTWLPDAMAGPTPVSALIHAATMVTAGVYLVVRLHPLFLLSETSLQIVGIVGAVTSLYAAICAMGQTDLKRVLAYSTVSQLGLMFLACGAGAFYAAMFHLTAHAFVKALLFLSAGNVVHMMHGTTEMFRMGGLSQVFTKTHWLFLIGVLAMSGIPPFIAFFSKDLILEQAHQSGYVFLYLLGIATSILTSFYLMRAYILTFTGERKTSEQIQEAPTVMLAPVTLLAVLSIFGGILGYSFTKLPPLERFLARSDVSLPLGPSENLFLQLNTWIALFGSLLGLFAALWLYKRYQGPLSKEPPKVLQKSFYVDDIYWKIFAEPLQAVSLYIVKLFEPKIFEGSLYGIKKGTQKAAVSLQAIQSGQIRSYVAWIVLGTVVLIFYFVANGEWNG